MYRLAALIFLILLPVSTLHADPIETLLSSAHAGDFAGVEAQIRDAPDRTAQRDLVWALAATDPATVDFTKAWVAAAPDNPTALTARAWSLYWAASKIRGERIRRHTWPPLLEEAGQMYREALSLAERATGLDPRFLPASDAVILLGVVTGRGEASLVELERIMALDPNRHSLVLTASNLTPAWGGSIELMEALCSYFAPQVADVPDYTSDICLAQSILRGQVWGERKDWAIMVVEPQADKSFLEREVMALAREYLLPANGIALLRARLETEGRMSVYPILAPHRDFLRMGDLPDKGGFAAALDLDIAAASRAADRDPGNPKALSELANLFEIEDLFVEGQVLRNSNPTDAEREAIAKQLAELRLRRATDLDVRARRLIHLAPRNTAALEFAVKHILPSGNDPLEMDRWALSALTNATIYANYQEIQLGRIVLEAKGRYASLRERMAAGKAPAYTDAQLDEVYLCPYIRAVRIVDAVCADHEWGVETCLLESVWVAPSESGLKNTLYSEIMDRGACTAERETPVRALQYDLVELKPLP